MIVNVDTDRIHKLDIGIANNHGEFAAYVSYGNEEELFHYDSMTELLEYIVYYYTGRATKVTVVDLSSVDSRPEESVEANSDYPSSSFSNAVHATAGLLSQLVNAKFKE